MISFLSWCICKRGEKIRKHSVSNPEAHDLHFSGTGQLKCTPVLYNEDRKPLTGIRVAIDTIVFFGK